MEKAMLRSLVLDALAADIESMRTIGLGEHADKRLVSEPERYWFGLTVAGKEAQAAESEQLDSRDQDASADR